MNGNKSSQTHCVDQGLLKQRSRRLLGNVIRRKMIVDNMDGYNDELQYNLAMRAPSYHRKDDDTISAFENGKKMQQQILRGHTHTAPGSKAKSPASVKTGLLKDRNANYVSNGFGVHKHQGTAIDRKTPAASHRNPPACPKSSARSAISTALFQSPNFKTFRHGSYVKPNHKEKLNQQNGNHAIARSIIIRVAANKNGSDTKRTRVEREHQKAGLESAYHAAPNAMITAKPKIEIPTHYTAKLQTSVQNFRPADAVGRISLDTKSAAAKSNENRTKKSDHQIPGSPVASQFRIKKISICGRPQDPASATRNSTNFVAGVSMYKKPSPSSITINLTPIEDRRKSYEHTRQAIPNEGLRHNKCSSNATTKTIETNSVKKNPLPIPDSKRDSEKIITVNTTTPFNTTPAVLNRSNVSTTSTTKYKTEENKKHSSSNTNGNISSLKNEKKCDIPKFFFPTGKPRPKAELDAALRRISEVCSLFRDGMVPMEEMGSIAKACNVSLYWKGPIFHRANDGNSNATHASEDQLRTAWTRVASCNNDPSSRLVSLLAKPGRDCLDFEDLLPLLKDIVDSHPGLIFLKDAPEFHTRYMNTVIARIFYVVNRSWSGQITASELRKSNFLTVLSLLEEEDDINAITDYFSYEHFYVIYCKFWELDSDHDLVIDKHDLIGYGDGVLSSRLIDRVVSGAVTRWDTSDHQLGKMSYVDFVWFILSEEDKKSATSIEYWYRCMDMDGDGCISMYEMEYFYEEQSQKLEQLDIEPLPFQDCVCQIFDIVNPSSPGRVTLRDLKKCKMAHVFFDTFFNVAKYLNNEQKDPFVATDGTVVLESDWDIFAAEEYELLVAEEQSNKMPEVGNSVPEKEHLDNLNVHEPNTAYTSMKNMNSIPISEEPSGSNSSGFLDKKGQDTLLPLNTS